MTPNLDNLRPVLVDDLVRIGNANDGGYVVSERSLRGCTSLIGLGINTDWSFEEDFLARCPTAGLIGVDGSVSAERFLREGIGHSARAAAVATKGRFDEARKEWRVGSDFRALRKSFQSFFSQPGRLFIERMISDAAARDSVSWDDVARNARRLEKTTPSRWFVKMDIEGGEYRVLPELIETAKFIQGMVVEFHACDLMVERFESLLAMLKQHFALVHIHGNNFESLIQGSRCPRVLELSFLNKSLVTDIEWARPNKREYPIANLDTPNLRGSGRLRILGLSRSWGYRRANERTSPLVRDNRAGETCGRSVRAREATLRSRRSTHALSIGRSGP